MRTLDLAILNDSTHCWTIRCISDTEPSSPTWLFITVSQVGCKSFDWSFPTEAYDVSSAFRCEAIFITHYNRINVMSDGSTAARWGGKLLTLQKLGWNPENSFTSTCSVSFGLCVRDDEYQSNWHLSLDSLNVDEFFRLIWFPWNALQASSQSNWHQASKWGINVDVIRPSQSYLTDHHFGFTKPNQI